MALCLMANVKNGVWGSYRQMNTNDPMVLRFKIKSTCCGWKMKIVFWKCGLTVEGPPWDWETLGSTPVKSYQTL